MPRTPSILPPTNVSSEPDKDTQKGLDDYTGPSAPSRVLYINLGLFKYGTDDKAHAAAIVLSLLLLTLIAITMVLGMFATNPDWPEKILTMLGSAFTLVAGVAIGRGSALSDRKNQPGEE
jgi:hypothetical protein